MGKYVFIGGVLLLMLGYGIGRYIQPPEVKTKIQEVVKEVEVVKKDVITVVKEVIRPDGTVEKETRTEDKSSSTSSVQKDKKESKTVEIRSKYNLDFGVGYNLEDYKQIYMLNVQKRVIGNVFIGGFYQTNKTVGLSIGMEF